MRKVTLFVLTLLVPLFIGGHFTTASQQEGENDADSKQLQGTWVAKKEPVDFTLSVEGDKFTFKMEVEDKKYIGKGILKMNPSKSPKTLDLIFKEAEGERSEYFKGKTALGIYKFENKNFVWCMDEPGNDERPDSFDTKKPNHLVLTYERKK